MKNEVTLGGNVVRDLEPRTAGRGKVANFTIAHNRSYTVKNGDSTEERQETSYIRCVAWNKLVDELMAENVGKGTAVEVVGQLQQRTYEDKNGIKREQVEINVREFSVISSQASKVKKTKVAAPSEDEFATVEAGTGDDTPF